MSTRPMTTRKWSVYFSWAILAVVALGGLWLRSWGIENADVAHDLAINSYRALGWLDYLGDKQTSPVNWFSVLPWWTQISFHDHPPLVFFIQHLAFRMLGENSLAAHVPFIIGGSLTIVLLYVLLASMRTPAAGLIAAGLYAVSAYAVWESRSGYLEGVEQVFIVAAIYFLALLCNAGPVPEAQPPREVKPLAQYRLLALGAALGAALLSKYTSVFLLPVAAYSLAAWNRRLWRTRGFWYGVAALIAMLTPLAVYNGMTYLSRGHFDAALSSMLGMHPADFGGIARRGVNLNVADNVASMIRILWNNGSKPFTLGLAAALGVSVLGVLRRRADRLTHITLLAIVGIVSLFAFSGASDRFLSIILPFLYLNAAMVWWDAWKKFTVAGFRAALLAMLLITAGIETSFTVSTQLLPQPRGGAAFAGSGSSSAGYEQLDQFLRANVLPPLGRPKKIRAFNQIVLAVRFREASLVLIDDRIDWFAQMWYVRRYQHYHGANLLDLSSFATFWRKSSPDRGFLDWLTAERVRELWLVRALDPPASADRGAAYAAWVDDLAGLLEQRGAETFAVTTASGIRAFTVYHLILPPPNTPPRGRGAGIAAEIDNAGARACLPAGRR